MKNLVKQFFEKYFGLTIVYKKRLDYPGDLDEEFYALFDRCKDNTMTSTARMYSLYQAISYLEKNAVSGDVVECGVWKGGSMMMCALTLQTLGDPGRNLWLYDTYEGMPKPGSKDISVENEPGDRMWNSHQKGAHNNWCYSALDEVRHNLYDTHYPKDKLNFVKGMVEDTIPDQAPDKIALLRLDTDWYDSIYHCLSHLYPKLVTGGILVLDDYGYWKGAKEAVDRYFSEIGISPMLNRIDGTGRLMIKQEAVYQSTSR